MSTTIIIKKWAVTSIATLLAVAGLTLGTASKVDATGLHRVAASVLKGMPKPTRPGTTSTTTTPSTNSTTTSPTPTTTTTTPPISSATSEPTASATTSTSSAVSSTSTSGTCAPSVSFAGSIYCVGYIYGVKRTLYGIGMHLLVPSVTVTTVQANVVTVMGGPSCVPDEFCGQTLPSMSVTFDTAPQLAPGDIINVYGITFTAGITPTVVQVVGTCNPDFGC